MDNKLDWDNDFKSHFHESWHELIKPAIESPWMYKIYEQLVNSREKVLPDSKDVFRSFTGNFNDIHTVLVLSDPYPWVKNNVIVADGIPMSCSHTNEQQPSLKKFYEAMQEELKDKKIKMSTDLSYLINQGCFMVNTALTVKQNKVGSHTKLWQPFMEYLFTSILSKRRDIPYWLMGNEAFSVERHIDPLSNIIIKTSHPASAAHKHTDWDSKGAFKNINTVIKNNFGEANMIIWDENKYDKEIDDLPF